MSEIYTNIQKTKISLSAKFISMMICILSITMGMSAYLSYSDNKKQAEKNLLQQAKANSKFLANVSQEAILSNDYITLDNYTSSISLVEDIAYGVILSKNGLPLSYYFRKDNSKVKIANDRVGYNQVIKIINIINKSKDISRATFPVKLDDEKIAEILIGIDKSRLFSLAKKDVLDQLKVNAFIILILSVFIYIIFKYNALEPIRELIKGSERIANGDLEKKVSVNSTDEIGVLASTFNYMMIQLKKSIESNDESINKLTFLNKTLEIRVKERTARLELAQRIARMGHWDLSSTNQEIHASSKVFNILGINEKEDISIRKFLKLIRKKERRRLYGFYKDAVMNHKSFEAELEIQREDNQRRYVSIISEIEIDQNYGVVLFGVIQDLTERKQSEISERNALIEKMDAEIANEAKSSFLANMSHEIRTPLTAIIGFSESMLSGGTYKWDKHGAEIILRNGNHLLSVINEILDLSKIESKKLEIEIIKTNLFQLIEDVAQLMKLQAMEKGLEFYVEYEYPMPVNINTDPTRLKQVFLNLCSNAIKFTAKGFVRINVKYSSIDESIDVIISDSGIGISPKQLSNLFQPFSQADATTTRNYGGTGLGLYISRELVRKMGGDIYIESLPAIGTKITFNVDVGSVESSDMITKDSEQIKFKKKKEQLNDIPKLSGSILLAEDSIDNQALFKLFIAATGASVDVASDGLEVVELSQKKNYDLILMDVQMPKMDGLQATREIISLGNNPPIVSLTANAMKQDRDNCEEAGCVGFLSKPIAKDEFYKVLSKYLPHQSEGKNTDKSNISDMDIKLDAIRHRFIENLNQQTMLIIDYFSVKNWVSLSATIHKLKGSAASFGFPNITRQSERIEKIVKDSDFENLKLEIDELIKMCKYAINHQYDE